jgi:hypothetical protein
MTKYICDKCGKEFSQKSHYNQHQNRKYPCIQESNLKNLIENILKDTIKHSCFIYENKHINTEFKITKKELESPCTNYKNSDIEN